MGLATAVFEKLGGVSIARSLLSHRLRIVMYHRFFDTKLLERQCEHLSSHYHVISLSEAVSSLRESKPLRRGSLVLTVDDGYLDFKEVAHPVFRRFGMPSTLYAVTEFADGKLWLWIDQIEWAFCHSPRREFRMQIPGGLVEGSWTDQQGAKRVGHQLGEALKLVANAERQVLLARLPELLDVEIPAQAPQQFAALNWDELRKLADEGVEIGAHSRHHPILSRVEPGAELEDEIGGAKRILEEQIRRPVRHFCYPNGLWRDITPEATRLAQSAGFESAVVAETGLNGRRADLYTLARIGIEPDLPWPYFVRKVAGAAR